MAKEGKPTEWVISLVYQRKADGKLLICSDPEDLKKAIRREHHVILTQEKVKHRLNGTKVFSTPDAKYSC